MEIKRLLLICFCIAASTDMALAKWKINFSVSFNGGWSVNLSITYESGNNGRKRSVGMDGGDEQMIDFMVNNATVADIMKMADTNCDGFLDVTEWIEHGTVTDFCTFLSTYDSNGDGCLTLEEVMPAPFMVDPNVDEFMLMPMKQFDDMMMMIDMDNNEEDDEGKGRKGPE